MKQETPISFYEELADRYHLLFEDWDQAVINQSRVWHEMFVSMLENEGSSENLDKNPERKTLLDCSCGIGTQAIGLAQRGYLVNATDLSPLSIERAKREAARLAPAASIAFGVADFRSLEEEVTGTYDIVISADNAIPHLLTDAELGLALDNMRSKLNEGGLLAISIRDYDDLIKNKPSTTPLRVMDQGKRMVFQVWNWDRIVGEAADGTTYSMQQFTLTEENGSWNTNCYTVRYRALIRSDLTNLLSKTGFLDIQWHMPEQSRYYQPIVTARR